MDIGPTFTEGTAEELLELAERDLVGVAIWLEPLGGLSLAYGMLQSDLGLISLSNGRAAGMVEELCGLLSALRIYPEEACAYVSEFLAAAAMPDNAALGIEDMEGWWEIFGPPPMWEPFWDPLQALLTEN